MTTILESELTIEGPGEEQPSHEITTSPDDGLSVEGALARAPRPTADSAITREQRRSRRKREVRARTISVQRMDKRQLEIGRTLYPEADLAFFLRDSYAVDKQKVILGHPDYAVWFLEDDGVAGGHSAAGPCRLAYAVGYRTSSAVTGSPSLQTAAGFRLKV